jgi:hypothetical protein
MRGRGAGEQKSRGAEEQGSRGELLYKFFLLCPCAPLPLRLFCPIPNLFKIREYEIW